MIKQFDAYDVDQVVDAIELRMHKFGESLRMASAIVLLNYADRFTKVICTQGEWEGTKKDILPGDGIPHCPNGHPLFEEEGHRGLILVNDN